MTIDIINQINQLLLVIKQEDYNRKINSLSDATIGGHVRHSIEMYQCLDNAYKSGVVDYSKRERNISTETDPKFAYQCFIEILKKIDKKNKHVTVKLEDDSNTQFESSYARELLYCTEHLIHHMALVKVGLIEIGGYKVSEEFGVAPSTINYRKLCAQ
ncbi:MAG: hypothetical protein QM528_09060 [Phycisphaerales bacterium]|nr:hypothetical protein [Phycisphaerales bacterium]